MPSVAGKTRASAKSAKVSKAIKNEEIKRKVPARKNKKVAVEATVEEDPIINNDEAEDQLPSDDDAVNRTAEHLEHVEHEDDDADHDADGEDEVDAVQSGEESDEPQLKKREKPTGIPVQGAAMTCVISIRAAAQLRL